MNGTVEEWLAKAYGDWQTARREFETGESPNYDAVCFHAQQCIEKTLKALLMNTEIVPPRTHDLLKLAGLVRENYAGWAPNEQDLRLLTRAGIAFRYPDEFADREDAEESLAACLRLRNALLAMIHS
jgi:HEPN domain-containing protein